MRRECENKWRQPKLTQAGKINTVGSTFFPTYCVCNLAVEDLIVNQRESQAATLAEE
jgi:hypothetical protein